MHYGDGDKAGRQVNVAQKLVSERQICDVKRVACEKSFAWCDSEGEEGELGGVVGSAFVPEIEFVVRRQGADEAGDAP